MGRSSSRMWLCGHHLGSWLSVIMSILFMAASSSDAAVSLGRNVAVELLSIDNPTDFAIMTTFIFVSYSFQYLGKRYCHVVLVE
jgi:hypothetical protein